MEIRFHDNTGGSAKEEEIPTELITWICSELHLNVKTLDIIYTDDQTLKNLHKDYLNDDTYTDVITFNLGDTPPIESEVYISIDRARENAGHFNVAFQNEIMRLLIHACLHLAGYEDDDEDKRKIMKKKEDEFLRNAEKKFDLENID
jgi:rRNA maturation RNase YbeY